MTDHTADWAGIRAWRARVPGVTPGITLPMIEICTVSAGEIATRVAAGELDVDVAIEHTSWFWVSNREEYRIAHCTARLLARGLRFDPGLLGHLRPAVFAEHISAHHIAQVAA